MKTLAIIIIAIQLAAGATLTLEVANRTGKSPILLFCLCLLTCHASLLGLWGAISKWRSVWRFSILAIGGIILTTEFHLAAKMSVIASLVVALTPVACLFAFHRAALIQASFVLLDPATLKRTAHAQFTILQVFALTTLVAIVTALTGIVSSPHNSLLGIRLANDYLVDMVTFSLCVVPVSIACVWALFSVRWGSPHWLALLIVPVLGGLFPPFYRSGPEPWVFVAVSFIQEVLVASVILPLRLQGYRFVRREPRQLESEMPGAVTSHPPTPS